jgi:Predicted permeases
MNSIIVAFNIVAPLFLLMALGYIIKLTKIMSETTANQVNSAIFKIFLPALVFLNIYNSDLKSSFNPSLLIFAVCAGIIQFFIALAVVLISEKDNSKRGVMLQGMFRSNFVLFGIPITSALYGNEAAGIASILVSIVIPMFNILAVISLETFNGGKLSIKKTLLGIIKNPLIIASVSGIIFLLLGIKLPAFLHTTVSNISQIATPLAFIILGITFNFADIKKYIRNVSLTLLMKLIVFPVIFITAAILLGFSGAPLVVLLTVFAAPVAVSSFSMAQQMGGDEKLAAQIVIFSTLFSIFTMFIMIFTLMELAFI